MFSLKQQEDMAMTKESGPETGIQPTLTGLTSTRNKRKKTCDECDYDYENGTENERPFSVSNLPNPEVFMQDLASDAVRRFGMRTVPSGYIIDEKYEILRHIGSGVFGNVYGVKVAGESTIYAMKIIKSKHSIAPSILREADILSHITRVDTERKSCIVRLIEALPFHQQMCIVYELLGPTLMEVLVENKRKGFSIKHVREITYQLATAVKFLHANRIIHHDIKPGNVCFLYSDFEKDQAGTKVIRRSDIRLIDFGSSVYSDQRKIAIATTRQYRSPEVGLRYTWSFTSDVWSIGCTAFELYTGRLLFQCLNEVEKCYMMEAILEQYIPSEMGKTSGLSCFNEQGILKYQNMEVANRIQDRVKLLNKYQINPEDASTKVLFNLLKKMLKIDQDFRISANDVLSHNFFMGMGPESE